MKKKMEKDLTVFGCKRNGRGNKKALVNKKTKHDKRKKNKQDDIDEFIDLMMLIE